MGRTGEKGLCTRKGETEEEKTLESSKSAAGKNTHDLLISTAAFLWQFGSNLPFSFSVFFPWHMLGRRERQVAALYKGTL